MDECLEKLAHSLSGSGPEILPYLPYLLQDLWELGSSPAEILELIHKHIGDAGALRILDLACGKGAVAIAIARTYPYHIKGVDILPEFIQAANEKAAEFGVSAQCTFVAEDINHTVTQKKDYDIVIFGAVGDVLGDPLTTLQKLRAVIKTGGYIILDDAYRASGSSDASSAAFEAVPAYGEWLELFQKVHLQVAGHAEAAGDSMMETNAYNTACIGRRADELKALHPEKSQLFEDYMQNQRDECKDMEDCFRGITWLLQKV